MSESSKSKFPTMETSAARGAKNASGEPSKNTKLMKKKGAQAGDPYKQPKPARKNVLRERSGARYGVSVKMPRGTSPEAGLTQSNGRIIPPAVNRSRPNFNAGMTE
jgi:hypothetical protein